MVHVFAEPAGRFDWEPHLRNCVTQPEFVSMQLSSEAILGDAAWCELFDIAKQSGNFIFISPPYDTFSRARHKQPGPRPLRSDAWPRGFPWLANSALHKVQVANRFIDQCLKATFFAAEVGSFFMWEAPEHFGRTADGNVPSSIWAWAEMIDCIPRLKAGTFVHYMCEFGADVAKPTRYLTNLPFFKRSPRPYATLPSFDADMRYKGPLPGACPHGHHEPTTGKSHQTQDWSLKGVCDRPAAFCQFMAAAIDFSLQADGGIKPSPPMPGFPLPSVPSGLVPRLDPKPTVSSVSEQRASQPPQLPPEHPHQPHSDSSRASASQAVPRVSEQQASQQPQLPPEHPYPPHSVSSRAGTTSASLDTGAEVDPEALAEELLASEGLLDKMQILRLFEALPREHPPRATTGDVQGSAFTTGAYCKGPLVGLRHNTTACPKSTQVLTKYLDQIAPAFQASAISIFENVRTVAHRDSRNAGHPNIVAPLTSFQGGEIWQEQKGGSVWEPTPEGPLPGTLLDVSQGPVMFDAWRHYHATRAWVGRRVVLVGYVTDKLESLQASDVATLAGLGFRLPHADANKDSETSEALATSLHERPEPTIAFKPEACGNRGSPIRVEWEGQACDITDGFGLCSPARWRPMDRGHRLSPAATAHAQSMYRMLTRFVSEHVHDPQKFCLSLLSGKVESSPFAGDKLEGLRKQWAELHGAGPDSDLLEIPDAQPFLLKALSRTAERLEDPDWEILTEGAECFCKGVPLGFKTTIPHIPQVYDRKEHWRKLDESELELDRANYKSAEMSSAELLEKFRAEEKLGRMVPTTMGALLSEYKEDEIRIASMGAISKPDGSVRPLHDGTHGVQVNNHIHLVNQLAVPGPAEMAFSVRQSSAMQEVPLAATADVSAAHRLVLHRKQDWALMACRAEQNSKTIWINKVGTFGLSAASFWWSRLYGIIGRVVARCLLQHAFYHFAYVDDVHPTFYGKRKFINFLVWLILQEMIGVPFAYHKFKGKTLVAFIGYELDYGSRLVGLSEARGAWVRSWVDEARKARYVVSVRKFAEFLGRLGFVARVVYWIKPHLSPLYAWSAAASKSHVAKMPDTVVLTLLYLEATLDDVNFKVAPGRVTEEKGHLFHTDAKCDDGFVVLGGWDSRQDPSVAKWFSVVVKPSDAPYLFDEHGKSQWSSASSELLATLTALWVFGHLEESRSQRRLPVAVVGATDNQSNERLLRKQSTTKWPLMLINMQLSHLLRKACLRLSLTWKPREENKLADALTNQDFSSFSLEQRVDVAFSDLPLTLLNEMWATKSGFDQSRKALSSASSFQPRVPKRKHEGTPW